MKVLDLFCGAGGASMGYQMAWPDADITGVDIKQQNNYPFKFVLGDALTIDLSGYDFIHASPPCQGYMQSNKNYPTKWLRLIGAIKQRLIESNAKWVIKNVTGSPLVGVTLCGTMFGLKVLRHRVFESNFEIQLGRLKCKHVGSVAEGDYEAVYRAGANGLRYHDEVGRNFRHGKLKYGDRLEPWSQAMDIDWMTVGELSEAIPPAYTYWIANQLS